MTNQKRQLDRLIDTASTAVCARVGPQVWDWQLGPCPFDYPAGADGWQGLPGGWWAADAATYREFGRDVQKHHQRIGKRGKKQ